jgi:tellurium resistance protein TerD
MSDIEPEEDLDKIFQDSEDDQIKPIDVGGKPEEVAKPDSFHENLPPVEEKPEPDQGAEGDQTEQFLKDAIPEEPVREAEDYDDKERNFAKKGDFFDLMEKRPQLTRLQIGVGWDQRNMEVEPIDLDVSVFLLNKEEETREDEDFIFYNHMVALEGGVKHEGDNRTGAGDGDDENISIDLNMIPFDILKIMIVLSVYDQDMKGHHIKMTRNIFVRIVDSEDKDEIVRFNVEEEHLSTATAIKMAALVREGPKWYFEPIAEPVVGGLGKVATEYGLIIQELASTNEEI